MNETGYEPSCDECAEALEAYVDGELEPSERSRTEAHLDECSSCREELALAIELRASLRLLPSLDAPRPVVAAVLETARAEADRHTWSWLEFLRPRPAFAALAAAALLVAIVVALFPGRPDSPHLAVDDPAVARATLEAKLALAHFARANRKIGLELGDEVVRERIVLPTTRGISRTLAPGAQVEAGDRVHSGGTVNERG